MSEYQTRSLRKRSVRDIKTPSSSPLSEISPWPDEDSDEDPTYTPSEASDSISTVSLEDEEDDE
jgi:hypothetical protein